MPKADAVPGSLFGGLKLWKEVFMLICLLTLTGVSCVEEAANEDVVRSDASSRLDSIFHTLTEKQIQDIQEEWKPIAAYLRKNNWDLLDITNHEDLQELLRKKNEERYDDGHKVRHLTGVDNLVKNLGNKAYDFNKAMRVFISEHKLRGVSPSQFQERLAEVMAKLKESAGIKSAKSGEEGAIDSFINMFGQSVAANLN